ncbi:MAG: hypothetical protein JNM00_16340 [Flavobacteriales bacterium]|nr:hypothetical protein [Flavobacteriales bacterium]
MTRYLIGVLLILSLPIWGQRSSPLYDLYTTADGLSSNGTTCVSMDARGYCWVGTSEGLNRFDGVRFQQFFHQPGDSASLPGDRITEILLGADGKLWIGTSGDGIALLQPDGRSFKTYTMPDAGISARGSNKVRSLVEFEGKLLVGTASGAFWYDETSDQFRNINDGWLTDENIYYQLELLFVVDSLHKGLWIRSRGEYFFLPEGETVTYCAANNPKGWTIFDEAHYNQSFLDANGLLWYQKMSENVLRSFDVSRNTVERYESPLLATSNERSNRIERIFSDGHGRLWLIRYFDGIVFEPGYGFSPLKQFSNYPGGLPGDMISSVYTAPDGLQWIATPSGLLHERPTTYDVSIMELESALSDEVIMHAWQEGDIVTLFSPERILRINRSTGDRKEWRLENSPLGQGIRKVQQLDDQYVLLQGLDYRLYTYDVNKDEISDPGFAVSDFVQDRATKVIYPAAVNDGFLWASLSPFGLVREDLVTHEILYWSTDQEGQFALPSGHVNALAFDTDGSLLIALGGGKGVYRLARASLQFEPWLTPGNPDRPFPESSVNFLLATEDHGVFLGLEGDGLMQVLDGKLTKYDRSHGIPSNNVRNIRLLDDNTFLIHTGNHILRFDPVSKKFERLAVVRSGSSSIVSPDGTANTDQLSHGVCSGRFFYLFDLTSKPKRKVEVQPSIVSLKAFDKVIYDGQIPEHIKLTYRENFFSLALSAFEFARNQQIEIWCMLEGFDPEWRDCSRLMEASYTNVPGGDYRFLMKTRSAGGEWTQPVVYLISIEPPFWETWWFKIAVVLALAAAVYGVYRYRLAQILRLQAVRNKIASDLHDDIGATLSSINIYSKLATDQLESSPTKSKAMLDRISARTTEMMDGMSDIVWSINPGNDSLHSVIARIGAHAAEVLGAMGIQVEVDNRTAETKLGMNARKNVFLIAKEAINNISKHSGASNVYISFDNGSGGFAMTIVDNGTSGRKDSIKGGNGMKTMQARAEEMGGKCSIHFDENRTVIALEIPGNKWKELHD